MNDYPRRQDTDTQNQRRNDELRKSQQPSFAPAMRDDGFEVFKKAYDAAPCGPLFKHEAPTIRASDREVAPTAAEQNQRVTSLIKAAHDSPGRWEPFAANQSIAKLLQDSVGAGERGEIFTENGKQLVRISKAA
ncbi:MAG TPA: hypothetical protein VJW93_15290 [Candidatus Acidoferrales bacterium]|nr:hypothetical protein [Candidatus Acidoferrales bacterium]